MRTSANYAIASLSQTFLHTGFMKQRTTIWTGNRDFSNPDFLSTFRTFMTVRQLCGKGINQFLTAIWTKHACSRLWIFKSDFFLTVVTSYANCHDLKMILNILLIRYLIDSSVSFDSSETSSRSSSGDCGSSLLTSLNMTRASGGSVICIDAGRP